MARRKLILNRPMPLYSVGEKVFKLLEDNSRQETVILERKYVKEMVLPVKGKLNSPPLTEWIYKTKCSNDCWVREIYLRKNYRVFPISVPELFAAYGMTTLEGNTHDDCK